MDRPLSKLVLVGGFIFSGAQEATSGVNERSPVPAFTEIGNHRWLAPSPPNPCTGLVKGGDIIGSLTPLTPQNVMDRWTIDQCWRGWSVDPSWTPEGDDYERKASRITVCQRILLSLPTIVWLRQNLCNCDCRSLRIIPSECLLQVWYASRAGAGVVVCCQSWYSSWSGLEVSYGKANKSSGLFLQWGIPQRPCQCGTSDLKWFWTSGFGFLKPLDLGYPTGSKPNQCLKLLPCWHGLATKQCPEADVMETSTGKQSALKWPTWLVFAGMFHRCSGYLPHIFLSSLKACV